MNGNGKRSWIDRDRRTLEFELGVNEFIRFSLSKPKFLQEGKVCCPCRKCSNTKYLAHDLVAMHLLHNGFVDNYYIWKHQGEEYIKPTIDTMRAGRYIESATNDAVDEGNHRQVQMVLDAGPSLIDREMTDEQPNAKGKRGQGRGRGRGRRSGRGRGRPRGRGRGQTALAAPSGSSNSRGHGHPASLMEHQPVNEGDVGVAHTDKLPEGCEHSGGDVPALDLGDVGRRNGRHRSPSPADPTDHTRIWLRNNTEESEVVIRNENGKRSWMDRDRRTLEFELGVNEFIRFSLSKSKFLQQGKVCCPCKKCSNTKYLAHDLVAMHLLHNGFVDNYYIWEHQGEECIEPTIHMMRAGRYTESATNDAVDEGNHQYVEMVLDAGPSLIDREMAGEEPGAEDRRGRGQGRGRPRGRGRGQTALAALSRSCISRGRKRQLVDEDDVGVDNGDKHPEGYEHPGDDVPALDLGNPGRRFGRRRTPPPDPADRTRIWLRNNMIQDSRLASTRTSALFNECTDCETGYQWQNVSAETKDWYWREFKKYFMWDEDMYPESRMKRAWRLKAGKLYRAWLVKLRRNGQRPDLLTESQWKNWCRWFDSDAFKEWSERNRRNRRGGGDPSTPAPATHTAGSNTFIHLAQKFARLHEGRMPTFIELYKFGHTVKNDMITWINASYELLGTEYERLFELVNQAAQVEDADVNEDKLYIEVARSLQGRDMSKRVFGLGQFGAGLRVGPQDQAESSGAADNRAWLDEEMRAELARLRMLYDALVRRVNRLDLPSGSSSATSMPSRAAQPHNPTPSEDTLSESW